MFTTTALPDAYVGTYYGLNSPPVTGGVGVFTFALTGGTVPPGIVFPSPPFFITGVPGFPAQKYTFSLTLTDTTYAGAFTTAATLSIDVLPPLPLVITTAPPVSSFAVNIPYSFEFSAAGGIPPYTWSLATGSSPLPPGLTLTTQSGAYGNLSGTPTAAGTTKNIILQVMDVDTPPAVSLPVTYSVTVNPSTNFVGTWTQGDMWQVVISHSDANDGIFSVTDEESKGTATESFATVNAGFRTYFSYFDGFSNSWVNTYGVEMQDQMALLQPPNSGGTVVAVANTCPQLAATFPTTANYPFLVMPTGSFATTDPSYGILALTQTASNSYNLTISTFQIDGTAIPPTSYQGASCDSASQTLSFPGASGAPVTVAISAAGALVIGGTNMQAVGVLQPAANLSPTAIIGGQYLGVEPISELSGSSSSFVGYGPSSGSSITGGTYANIASDNFATHAVDEMVTLGTQTSPGLFTGGTFYIPYTQPVPDFNVVVGQVNGKFVFLGMGYVKLDSITSVLQVMLLIQQ